MDFFKRKKVLPPLFSEAEFAEVATYEQAVAFLEGLGPDEYAKVIKVVEICRQAQNDCAEALGQPLMPSTFINPKPPVDEDEPNFLDDMLDEKPKNKSKKIKVND